MDNYNEEVEVSYLSHRPRDVDFRTVVNSGELGSQRNTGQETRTKVTHQDFSGSGLMATITRLCYGTYNEKKACLIVVQFSFHWSKDDHKFKRVEAEISFRARPQRFGFSSQKTQVPVVRNLCPRKAYGKPNTNGKKWFISVEQLCDVPTSADGVHRVKDNLGPKKAFEEDHRVEIVGRRWSDSRRVDFHKACWTVREIGKPSFGIPDKFDLAVLVEYEDDFEADVRVTVDVPLHRKLQGFPWPVDDPILFTSKSKGSVIGRSFSNTQFEKLTDDDWGSLISGLEVGG